MNWVHEIGDVMIESIQIQNQASYGSPYETLTGLSKFNFIYGSNGSGKATISRIIANESAFPGCRLVWLGIKKRAKLSRVLV